MNNSATHTNRLQPKTVKVQLVTWLLFYIFLLLYMMQKWEHPGFGFWSATVGTIFYASAVYGNALLLIPRFYKQHKQGLYFFLSALFLLVLMAVRVGIDYFFLYSLHPTLYGLTSYHFSFVFITNLLAFLFGALLRIAVDHVVLLRRQDEMRAQHAATELAMLKAQVQPHFLFNSLNNIYYLAYTKNERTATVVAKLSDIMRYFVDEAPKENLPLATEIHFLENYIELEQIRMVNRANIQFDINVKDTGMAIPPMLLMPLVENIFKHGIDKTLPENTVSITLEEHNGKLVFTTENGVVQDDTRGTSGQGLANLQKRLALLFGDNYAFKTHVDNNRYTAILTFAI